VQSDLEILPYFICIFAGIGPKEVERLEWSNVNLEEHDIEISEEHSKTETRRVVQMEPVLVRWLEYFAQVRGQQTGSIAVTSNFRKRLRTVRKNAGLERWPTGCATPDVRFLLARFARGCEPTQLFDGPHFTGDALQTLPPSGSAEAGEGILGTRAAPESQKTRREKVAMIGLTTQTQFGNELTPSQN
jgi:hypothetical protein